MTKIQVFNENIQRFGGINFILDTPEYKKILHICETILGWGRKSGGGFSCSEVVNVLFLSILCGATCIEDVNQFARELRLIPGQKAPGADTVLRLLERLSVMDEALLCEGSGNKYAFNRNHRLNDFLVKVVAALGLVKKGGKCDFDYDNQIIETEKWDAVRTYKGERGYAPGIAFADGTPIYIEGRSGDAPVAFSQAGTLTNAYESLRRLGITVRRSRMDAGSYSKEVVAVVEKYSELFYIRNKKTDYYTALTKQGVKGWRRVSLIRKKDGGERIVDVRSLIEDEFLPGKTLRVVLYRYAKEAWLPDSLFKNEEPEYRYFGILTNDFESTEEEIIEYYNGRGSIERVFDQMNNDFNWKHLPCSNMNRNTVFMLLTAVLRNFFTTFVLNLSKRTGGAIHKRSRLKAFIYHFITCPAIRIKTKTEDILRLYGATTLQIRYIQCTYST